MGKAWVKVPRVSIEMALAYGWGPCHLKKPLRKAHVLAARVMGEYLCVLIDSPDLPDNKAHNLLPTYDPWVISERQPQPPKEPDGGD